MNFARRQIQILQDQRPGERMDAASTQSLERALISMKAEILRTEFGPLKAADLIPVALGTPPGAEQVSYRLYTDSGVARIVANYAEDIPMIDVALEEFLSPVFTVAAAYQWTWQDMERAQQSGFQLSVEKPRAVREAIARKIDEIAAIGVPEAAVGGFVNHANVPTIDLTNGDWLDSATTEAEILEDLLEFEDEVISNTLEHHYADTLVLPGAYYRTLMLPRASGSDRTIWEQFVASSQLVSADRGTWSIERWSYLDSVEGEARAVMYQRDPSVLELEIPLEYDELAPQPLNLAVKVPAVGRVGGCIWKRPLAAAYATNIDAT